MRSLGFTCVRTTLAIDDDVLAAAKGLAQRQNKTIGEVISGLARQALRPAAAKRSIRNGVPLLPGRAAAPPVSSSLVNELRDESP